MLEREPRLARAARSRCYDVEAASPQQNTVLHALRLLR